MRRSYITLLLMISIATLAGCNDNPDPVAPSTPPPAANATQPQSASGGAETSSKPEESVPVQNTRQPVILSGIYVISEVHQNGVATTISQENSTQIKFKSSADLGNKGGTFDRVSRAGGKVDHTDSGQYVIEGTDQLILNILVSRKKMVDKPVQKRFKYTLSADGEELKLATEDSNIAVFRKTGDLPVKRP